MRPVLLVQDLLRRLLLLGLVPSHHLVEDEDDERDEDVRQEVHHGDYEESEEQQGHIGLQSIHLVDEGEVAQSQHHGRHERLDDIGVRLELLPEQDVLAHGPREKHKGQSQQVCRHVVENLVKQVQIHLNAW